MEQLSWFLGKVLGENSVYIEKESGRKSRYWEKTQFTSKKKVGENPDIGLMKTKNRTELCIILKKQT